MTASRCRAGSRPRAPGSPSEHVKRPPAGLTRSFSGRAVLVDAGAWLAFLHRRDSRHREADRALRALARSRERLFTTDLVVAEVHRLLLHRVGIQAARAFLERLATSAHVEIELATTHDHEAARRWLARLADQRITYTDAVSFAVMDRRRCRRVLSFDRHFAVAGFELYRSD